MVSCKDTRVTHELKSLSRAWASFKKRGKEALKLLVKLFQVKGSLEEYIHIKMMSGIKISKKYAILSKKDKMNIKIFNIVGW